MYKKKYHSKSGTRKLAIALLSGVMAVSLGLAAACTTTDDDDDKNGGSTSSSTDKQTILNGNFEFFDDSDDKTHIIYTPDSWSLSTAGRTNYVMNGIVNTSKAGWARIDNDHIADDLQHNEDLDEDDDNYEEEYVDYNGMRVRDIPYANPHLALRSDATEADKTLIENPYTHNMIVEGEGDNKRYYYNNDEGEKVELTEGDDGLFYKDADKKDVFESHVLMIHNYYNSTVKEDDSGDETTLDYDSYGTAQYYTSASTITLEPNTAAELSVWVKTESLMFDRNGAAVDGGLGAYISVSLTVGGNEVDTFYIGDINTASVTENNGWVQYKIYVQGCDFASSTLNVELGLGRAEDDEDFAETVEGYAFFDDLTCTQYPDIDDSENYQADKDSIAATCNLSVDGVENEYSYDEFGGNRSFLIDLASGSEKVASPLNANTVKAWLTEDADHYVTSSTVPSFYQVGKLDVTGTVTNNNLDINTTNDVIASFGLSDIDASIDAASGIAGVEYYSARIAEALAGAADLPGAEENGNALMILSSRGAAYTSQITGTGDSFTMEPGEYKIVSFWVKTSDMDGNTAATIDIVDTDDEDVYSTLTVDTTDVTFDVGEQEDIYNGWVQCFFFVENTLDEAKTFRLDFSFGNSTIKDTTISAYRPGYAVLTNIQTFDIENEDIFGLASTGTYAASFTFSTTDNRSNNFMDEVYGALSNNIKDNITRPASYNGVNGASASVVFRDSVDASGYDKRNANDNAGLINKDYFENYLDGLTADPDRFQWLNALVEYNQASALSALDAWNKIFGSVSVQPLLIVNTVRTIGEAAALNYGFIADSATTVAASGYQAITTRVKVSKGAVAYVYLTDPDTRTDISTFELPAYSFWYDSMGNVLDGEPDYNDDTYDARAHVVYTLQNNGLYTDRNGNYFANLYNYEREYFDEAASYFDAEGTEVSFDELDSNEIYYISAEEAAKGDEGQQSPHYLVATNSDGTTTKVFEYRNGAYYYIVNEKDSDGNATISYTGPVESFVKGKDNGGADLRYNNTSADSTKQLYMAIDGRYDAEGRLFGETGDPNTADISQLGYNKDGEPVADKWQEVTFFVHTGDESANYTLELWSGAREYSGVASSGSGTFVADSTNGSVPGSYVIFDYNSISADEDTYTNFTQAYTDEIIRQYIELFDSHGLLTEGMINEADRNIAYYEELFDGFVESGDLTDDDEPAGYDAMYYTYSLYDDAGYIPFNGDIAESGETGYDYSPDDYSETLVYLSYRDKANSSSYIFVDYSATNVTVSTGSIDDSGDDDEETTESNTNVWLLVASIILAVALIFTLISLFIRDLLKKRRINPRKHTERNVYAGKRKHYIRKLGLTEEVPAEDAEKAEGETADEVTTPAEETTEAPAEESAPEEAEAPAESAEAAEGSADEAAAEGAEETEAPATETPAEAEAPAEKPEGEDK